MGNIEYGKGGPFIAQKHAFHFRNSWEFNESDAHELNERLLRQSLNEVVSKIQSLVRGELSRMSIPIPYVDRLPSIPTPCGDIKIPDSLDIPKSLIDVVLDRLHTPILDYVLGKFLDAITGSYGRCGGMAFAGLDFYHAKWPVDARFGESQCASWPLRDYIWRRLLDSLGLNLTEFIWVKVKYLLLPDLSRIATDVTKAVIGASGGRVASIISNYIISKANIFNFSFNSNQYSINSWNKICHKLKQEEPAWPMGLVFNSYKVWGDHQILVIGYKKFESGGLLRQGNRSMKPAQPVPS